MEGQAIVNEKVLIIGEPQVVISVQDVELGDSSIFTIAFQQNIGNDWAWSWDFDNDGIEDSDISGMVSYKYESVGSSLVSLTLTESDGITTHIFTKTANVLLELLDPIVVFSVQTVTVEETSHTIIEYSKNIESDWVWSWDFDNDNIEDENTKGGASFVYDSSGEYLVTLSIYNDLNEKFKFTNLAKVLPKEPKIVVNGLMTINDDGINDVLIIDEIESYPENILYLYDRSGKLVFELYGYNNRDKVFKGISNTSAYSFGALPLGNYFYIIDKGDDSKPEKGYIYLK